MVNQKFLTFHEAIISDQEKKNSQNHILKNFSKLKFTQDSDGIIFKPLSHRKLELYKLFFLDRLSSLREKFYITHVSGVLEARK